MVVEKKSRFENYPAVKIALVYLAFSASWILLSDYVVYLLFTGTQQEVQTVKGLFFVFCSSALIYTLVFFHARNNRKIKEGLEEKIRERTQRIQLSNTRLSSAVDELRVLNNNLYTVNEELQRALARVEDQSRVILEQKDEQLNRVLENSQDVIFSLDLIHQDHYFSRSATPILGNNRDHLKDDLFWINHTIPADRSIRKQMLDALRKQGAAEGIVRWSVNQGEYRWMFERHRIVIQKGVPVRHEAILTDISALKEAERKLEEDQLVLRSLIDNLPDFVYVKDASLRLQWINKKGVEVLANLQTEVWQSNEQEKDWLVIEQGQALVNEESRLITSTGEERTMLITRVPLMEDSGGVSGLVTIGRDITELRHREAMLKTYRENLDIVFRNTSENILLLDHEGKVLLHNHAMEQAVIGIRGSAPQPGEFMWNLTSPDRRELSREYTLKATKGVSTRVDAVFDSGAGKMVFDVRYNPVFIGDQVKYIIVLSTNVTEKRLQEEALRISQQNLDIIFSNTTEKILLLDRAGRIVMFNRAFAEFGRITGNIPAIGESAWSLDTEEAKEWQNLFLRALNGESFVIDKSFAIGNDTVIHELHYLPVYSNGKVSHVTITANDVTEKRMQEIALRQSEASLQGIFSSTNEVFILVDTEFCIKTFNRAFTEYWLHVNQNVLKGDIAFDREQIVGKNIFLFLQGAPIPATDIMVQMKAGEVVQFIWKIHDKDNTRWYQVTLQPLYAENRLQGHCVTLINQTDVRRAKENLIASELLFRSLVENSDDVFMIANDQMVNLFVSPNVVRVLGYSAGEMLGKSNTEFIHPEDLKDVKNDLHTISRREGQSIRIARRLRHKDGHWVFVEGIVINRFETAGIGGRLLIYHDVTDRKRKESRILELHDALADFQQAIYRSSIVSRANRQGVITFVNDNFVNISGYAREELIGQNHRIINSDYHPREFWQEMWRTITQGKIWRQEVRNKARDGSYYWVDTFIMPFFDEHGEIREFLSIRNDITQRKKTEEELVHSQYMLDKANEVAKIGYWSYDVMLDKFDCNEQALALLDLQPHEQYSLQSFMQNIHPEDTTRINQFFHGRSEEARTLAIDYRVKPVNDVLRWLHAEAKEFRNEKGQLTFILGIVQDITERKIIEEILREYNDRFEMVFKATNDAIWDWDIEHDFEVWNQGIENIFGYRERTISQPQNWWKDKIHPDDFSQVSNTIDMAFAKHESHWSTSYRYKCADGSFKHVLDRAYILYKDNKPTRMIGAMQDITQQKEALQEIEKLSLVASKTNNAVVITDASGKIEWTNKAFTELTGYMLDESIGKKPGEFLQGAQTDKGCVARISEALRSFQPIKEELINYDKNGRAYWVRMDIAPVFDNQQNLKHFIAVETDITDQKEYESNITAIARELTSLIENANVPIFGLDRNGYINEWNHVAAEISGYHRNEVLTRKWSDFIQPRLHRNISVGIKRVFSGHPIVNFELPFISKAGKQLVFLMSVSPRRDIRNKIVGVICVAQDITEVSNYRHGLERIVEARTRELNIALQKEKELVDMKTKFVSIASHEFRTPLASISMASGFLQRYRDRMTKAEIENKLLIIDKQVDHMTVLLDDVLMIGKAEAGKIAVSRKRLPMREFVERVVEDVRSSTQYTHIVRIFWPEELVEFNTDEKLMRNIFINLLSNAIKFSPEANVVDLRLEMLVDGMQLRVRDYGIGIPEQDRKVLFQTFQRGSNVSTIQGTGLGLAIVKKAIDLLGGSINIESAENDGTTFIVFIPFME